MEFPALPQRLSRAPFTTVADRDACYRVRLSLCPPPRWRRASSTIRGRFSCRCPETERRDRPVPACRIRRSRMTAIGPLRTRCLRRRRPTSRGDGGLRTQSGASRRRQHFRQRRCNSDPAVRSPKLSRFAQSSSEISADGLLVLVRSSRPLLSGLGGSIGAGAQPVLQGHRSMAT